MCAQSWCVFGVFGDLVMARKNKDFFFDWGGHTQQTAVWSYLDVVALDRGLCASSRGRAVKNSLHHGAFSTFLVIQFSGC